MKRHVISFLLLLIGGCTQITASCTITDAGGGAQSCLSITSSPITTSPTTTTNATVPVQVGPGSLPSLPSPVPSVMGGAMIAPAPPAPAYVAPPAPAYARPKPPARPTYYAPPRPTYYPPPLSYTGYPPLAVGPLIYR